MKLIKFRPEQQLAEKRRILIEELGRLKRNMEMKIFKDISKLKEVKAKLLLLSPYAQLDRGYMIARKLPELSVVKGVEDVEKGNRINLLAKGGEIDCTIDEVTKKEREK
ncbi:MAG: hypothetical protein D6734_11405 [Candidatus Schekmanbacteria bacterium]|nr:MAG: hypothetical protein D6734_11405 [Candidatus Schekmanbacteria bacterium]